MRSPRRRRRSCGLVGVARPPALVEGLQVVLERGQGGGVDELPQLLGAQQLGQHLPVEGEGLGPALGEGGVALVEEVGHVGEGQRARRTATARRSRPTPPGCVRARMPVMQVDQGGEVEDVAQALAVRLQQDRELAVLGGHRQQVGGPLAHLPQRRAGAGPAPGQQQGAGRVLPEPGREQRRVGQLADDQLLDLVGLDQHHVERAAPRRPRAGGRRCPRRSRWSGPRGRAGRGPGPRWPAPTGRAPGRRTARARTPASRPARRGSARRRSGGRWAARRR